MTLARNTILFLAAAAALTFASATPAAQARLAKATDPSFGNHGVALSQITPYTAYSWELAAGAGRVVTSYARESGHPLRSKIMLAEFDPAGAPIGTFGNAGVASYDPKTWVPFFHLTLDPQGRILLLQCAARTDNFYEQSLELLRLRADGSIDQSFNNGQPLVLDTGDEFDAAQAKITPSGRIVVFNASLNNTPTLYAVTEDGHLDPGYGSAGRLEMPVDNVEDPDALLDALGTEWTYDALADDGSTYMSMTHPLGTVKVPGAGRARGFIPWIFKFGPDGRRDTTFGKNGRLTIKRSEPAAYVDAAGVRADGGLTALVFARKPLPPKGARTSSKELAMRFNSDGSPAASAPRRPSAPSFPISKVTADGFEEQTVFAADGAIQRLDYGERQFELAWASANGTSAHRSKIFIAPRTMKQFDSALIDPTHTHSVLIGGGVGKRMAIVRLRFHG